MENNLQQKKQGISAEKFMPFLIMYAKLKNEKQEKYNSRLWQQKMLFFVHFNFLKESYFFKDKFEAWVYGPVISSIYDLQKNDKNWLIDFEVENSEKLKDLFIETFKLDKNKEELEKMWKSFENTFENYIKFSPMELMKKTHKLNSWINNFKKNIETEEGYFSIFYDNNIIPDKDLEEDLNNE